MYVMCVRSARFETIEIEFIILLWLAINSDVKITITQPARHLDENITKIKY